MKIPQTLVSPRLLAKKFTGKGKGVTQQRKWKSKRKAPVEGVRGRYQETRLFLTKARIYNRQRKPPRRQGERKRGESAKSKQIDPEKLSRTQEKKTDQVKEGKVVIPAEGGRRKEEELEK